MLVLSRRHEEKITIDIGGGQFIELVVIRIDKGRVKIGIDAPKTCPIFRNEIMPDHLKPKGKK